MSDKMREEFEEWAERGGHSIAKYELPNNNDYWSDFTQFAWEAWQAAKSVPVVGEPVAYGVKDNGVLWTFTTVAEHASRASTMGSEIVPLIIKPINSITAAELERLRDALEIAFQHIDKTTHCNDWATVAAAIAAEGEKK